MPRQKVNTESGKRLVFAAGEKGQAGKRRVSGNEPNEECCCECFYRARPCPGQKPIVTSPPCFPCDNIDQEYTFRYAGTCWGVRPANPVESCQGAILDITQLPTFGSCNQCRAFVPPDGSEASSIPSSASEACWRVPEICVCSGSFETADRPVVPCSHVLSEDPCIFEFAGDCYTATANDPEINVLGPNDVPVEPQCAFSDCQECCDCNTCAEFCGTCSDPPQPTDPPGCDCNDTYTVLMSGQSGCPCDSGPNSFLCHTSPPGICCDRTIDMTFFIDRNGLQACDWVLSDQHTSGILPNEGDDEGCDICIELFSLDCGSGGALCPGLSNVWFMNMAWIGGEYIPNVGCLGTFCAQHGNEYNMSAFQPIGEPCTCPDGVYTTCRCGNCSCPDCISFCEPDCGMIVVI